MNTDLQTTMAPSSSSRSAARSRYTYALGALLAHSRATLVALSMATGTQNWWPDWCWGRAITIPACGSTC